MGRRRGMVGAPMGEWRELGAAHVVARFGGDFDFFAFFDEEGDIDDLAGFEGGGLLDVIGAIAADAFGGFGDGEDHGGGEGDVGGLAFYVKDFAL